MNIIGLKKEQYNNLNVGWVRNKKVRIRLGTLNEEH